MVELVETTDEKGLAVSTTLPKGCKNFLIDIDGTVCEDIPNEVPERMATAQVFPDVVEIINRWYEKGHIITFFTGRLSQHAKVTEAWLEEHGFKYHGVIYNKPRGGNYHWVDNHTVRATKFNSKFTEFVKRRVEVEVFDDLDGK